MKKGRRILFTTLFATIIVGICIACFILGRGHTVYFDNKNTDDGKYKAYDSIKVYVDGSDKGTSIGARERISADNIGQKMTITVEYRQKSNSKKESQELTIVIPYSMDGVIVNLPAALEGASEEEYLSEFVSTVIAPSDDETPSTEDDMGLTTDE